MKNTITIIVPIILGYFLSSCGTTTGLTTAVYQDAIYQKPDANGYIVVNTNNDKEIEVLRGKTKESNGVYINGKLVEPLYVDEKGNVEINIGGEEIDKTYLVLNPGESFEERLTKFENPQYTININYDPFNDYFYWYYSNPFRFWRVGSYYWGNYWYNPWRNFGRYYGYFSIDPFIGMDYFWWSSMYMPIYHRPWDWYYASWHYPGDGYGYWYYNWNDPDRYRYTSSRDFYYGRRESQRSDKNNSTAVVSGGSYIRREANVEQVRGSRPYNGNLNSSESLYRRDNRFENQNRYQESANSGQMAGNQGNPVRRQSADVNRSSGSYNRNEESVSGNNRSSVTRNSSGSVTRNSNVSVTRNSNSSVTRNSESSYRNSGTSTSSRSGNSNSSGNYRPSENQRSVSSGSSTYSRSSGSNNNSSYNSSRFDSGSSRGYVNTSSGASSAGSSSGSSSNTSSSSSSSSSSGSSYRR